MEYSVNSVISDNFLIYSGIRAIEQTQKFFCRPIPFESYKVVFDICSLASLVEMLILHDKIYTDPATMIWECPTLSDCIEGIPIDVREPCMSGALGSLRTQMDRYARFCEKVLPNFPMESCISAILMEYGGARDYDVIMADDFMPIVDHHLIKPAGFLLGARYYELVSSYLQMPYVPHPARCHVSWFDMIPANRINSRSLADKIQTLLDDNRRQKAANVNDFFGTQIFSLTLPVVFAAVLKRAKRREDILDEAIKLRDSLAGKDLRAWMAKFVSDIQAGKLTDVTKSLDSLVELVDGTSEFNTASLLHGVQITLGPVKIDPSIGAIGSLLNRLKRRDKLRISTLIVGGLDGEKSDRRNRAPFWHKFRSRVSGLSSGHSTFVRDRFFVQIRVLSS